MICKGDVIKINKKKKKKIIELVEKIMMETQQQ